MWNPVDTPQPMFYNKYREYRNLSRMNASQSIELFFRASEAFQQAKTIFEMISNVHSEVALLLKVAKTNFVVAKLAAGGHKKDSMNPLEFDFQCHRAFPIIKLKWALLLFKPRRQRLLNYPCRIVLHRAILGQSLLQTRIQFSFNPQWKICQILTLCFPETFNFDGS